MSEQPLLLTPKRAADRLDIGRTKIFELIATGELESVTIGRARRVPADALVAYVNRLRSPSAA